METDEIVELGRPAGSLEWMDDAACVSFVRKYPDSNLWTSSDQRDRLWAMDICQTCPVYIQCLNEMLASGATAGIWAGREATGPIISQPAWVEPIE